MLLDDFLPVYHFTELHSTTINASPDAVYRAVKEVTPSELSWMFHLLFRIRALPARLSGQTGGGFSAPRPLLDQMLNGGFVLLVDKAEHEIVFGMVGQFWKLTGGTEVPLAHPQDFVEFEQPDYAKVAGNFYVSQADGYGNVRVSTESRTYVPDPRTRKKFGRYWRVIYPGSAYIRVLMLKAIKRRAERSSSTRLTKEAQG
jgi:hypothetical protein